VEPPHPPRELAIVSVLSLGLASAVIFLPPGSEGSLLATLRPTLTVLALMGPPWVALERRKRDPLVELGLSTRPRAPWTWLVALATLPLYVLGFALWRKTFHPVPLSAWFCLSQLVFVALPEETFFRGSFQPSVLPERPYASIIITSVVFALAHLVSERNPLRLLVFFPSLLFGWLRLRSGSVVPGIVFHALSNVVEDFVGKATFPG
jgi:membrane protease YdiL (CAAX protease family)